MGLLTVLFTSGAVAGVGGSQQRFVNTASTTKYSALNLAAEAALPAGLSLFVGEGERTAKPLMQQTEIWEPRCDNGYPNVIHNPADPNGAYRLWYGCFSSGTEYNNGQGAARTNAWMYANSSDGVTWTKPHLGVYDLSTGAESRNKKLPAATLAAFHKIKTNNNIVMGDSDGMGITLDDAEHETNASLRFKAFGTGHTPSGPGPPTGG